MSDRVAKLCAVVSERDAAKFQVVLVAGNGGVMMRSVREYARRPDALRAADAVAREFEGVVVER